MLVAPSNRFLFLAAHCIHVRGYKMVESRIHFSVDGDDLSFPVDGRSIRQLVYDIEIQLLSY